MIYAIREKGKNPLKFEFLVCVCAQSICKMLSTLTGGEVFLLADCWTRQNFLTFLSRKSWHLLFENLSGLSLTDDMQMSRLLAVDHSARTSMKSAANCVNGCELQYFKIIDNSNANCNQCFDTGYVRLRVDRNNTYIRMCNKLARQVQMRFYLDRVRPCYLVHDV